MGGPVDGLDWGATDCVVYLMRVALACVDCEF